MTLTNNRVTVEINEFRPDWGPDYKDPWNHRVPDYRADADWDEARTYYDCVPAGRKFVADKLWEANLGNRATRFALCGRIARTLECKNRHRFLGIFRCMLRCCQECSGRNAQRVFAKHLELGQLCKDLDYDLALIEIVIHNPNGRFPEAWMVQQFNRECKVALKSLFGKKDYRKHGTLLFEQFFPNSPDLRVRILVYGAQRPLGQVENAFKKAAHLVKSELACVRSADSFRQGLGWVTETILPKPGECLDPDWLAGVEMAFKGVRRLHALGIFHNPETEQDDSSSTDIGGGGSDGSSSPLESTDSDLFEQEIDEALRCPKCGEPLHAVEGYKPLEAFRESGLVDVEAYSSGQVRAVGRVP